MNPDFSQLVDEIKVKRLNKGYILTTLSFDENDEETEEAYETIESLLARIREALG